MSRPSLLFIHGWGFDAGFWDPLRSLLCDFHGEAADLGYFGAASTPEPQGPVLVVAHSLGAMLALADPPSGCAGLVAINGFDRFGAGPDFPGVPRRVVDRMLEKVERDPAQVVSDFRRRCGEHAAFEELRAGRLAEHLLILRDGDERSRSGAWQLPLLVLQGERDPILPPELRAKAFAGTRQVERRGHADAGHALPLTHADWCAGQVRILLEALP